MNNNIDERKCNYPSREKDYKDNYNEVFWEKHGGKKRFWRNSNLKSKYGITLDKYEEMLESQNNSCAICKTEKYIEGSKRRLSVDHCHKTKRVRGLLCFKCNTALGKFQDDIDLLESAISYLKSSIKGI